jgi:hypothetical protein
VARDDFDFKGRERDRLAEMAAQRAVVWSGGRRVFGWLAWGGRVRMRPVMRAATVNVNCLSRGRRIARFAVRMAERADETIDRLQSDRDRGDERLKPILHGQTHEIMLNVR